MKRLVLVGGGHAHLSVLRALARNRPPGIEVLLVTPSAYQNYSGMLPGWMAGHYTHSQCRIDLQPLAQAAQVRLVTDRIAGMDADRRCVGLSDGQHIEYDLLSLDVGSEIDVSWLKLANDRLFPVRPLDDFFSAWPNILAEARRRSDYRLVVVGGGAAGVEIALAARHAFTQAGSDGQVDIVVSESGMLTSCAASVRRRMARVLAHADIAIHQQRAVGAEQGVMLSNGALLRADSVIAATGSRAPCWSKLSRLMRDEHDYIVVDAHHRSLSHPNVFAAGDICARQDRTVARSGVHAVHAGPVLAKNLLSLLQGGTVFASYQPRKHSLYLLSCGAKYAIASWGGLSAEGEWVWRWKDWIDQRFIKRFSGDEQRAAVLDAKEAS